jgi:hypothetical protein
MMMDENEVAAVWLLHKRINNAPLGKGAFHVLSEEIKSDPNNFFNYYRSIKFRQHHLKNS